MTDHDNKRIRPRAWTKTVRIASSVSLALLISNSAFEAIADAEPSRTTLSLNIFLDQVAKNNEAYRAADASARGAKLRADEGRLVLLPTLSGSASFFTIGLNDPSNQNNEFTSRTYSLGISQLTDFGLSAKVSANRSDFNVNLPPFVGGYSPNWFQLDLSQSLWRNWAGGETIALSEASTTSAHAASLNQSYLAKTILLEAESSYWRLALARELVTVSRDSVERAQRLSDWAANRAKLQLTDRAEYLQASTALQARKLDLRTAQDNESSAARALNSARGIDSDVVAEALELLTPEATNNLKLPQKLQTREDVRAAEMQAKASAASAKLNSEKNKPTLEVFASLPLSTPADPSPALNAVIPASSRAGTTVGLKFSSPLWFDVTDRARQGYAAEAEAAQTSFHRKQFEEERDWTDLVTKFKQSQERLRLYQDLERTQKEKLIYEREREKLGRSTLQQVLLDETDYQLATQGRISTLTELLTINAQMKLYGAYNESR